MYLSHVRIKNFRGYGENPERDDHCYVYDKLDSQLVVFHGYNGFGKTSFYEAIEWCLTDNVYRLEKFYSEKTYQAPELKKSHYLKFYHPIHGNKEDREIYVELLFSNGFRIVRTTKSNVLRTTDKDNLYSSEVSIGFGDEIETSDNQKLLHMFISDIKDKTTFFHTHLLGQESISDFLRRNSPSERRRIFMQLLQEEELNKTFQSLEKYTNGNNVLTGKKSQLEKEREKYKSDLSAINNFIEKLGFKNVTDYLQHIETEYANVKPLILKNVCNRELDLSLITIPDKVTLNNCVTLLQGVNITNEKANSLKNRFINEQDSLMRIKQKLATVTMLKSAKSHISNAEHANKLKQHKINELKTALEEHTSKCKNIEEQMQICNLNKQKASSYSNNFLNLAQNISTSDLALTSEFWLLLKEEVTKWRTFINTYQQQLKEKNIDTNITEIDSQWFLEIKKKEAALQVQRKKYQEELAYLQGTKRKVTSLNDQYQKALDSVKQLIMSTPDNINECPVCLNEDFENDKYSKEVKNWNEDAAATEKLLAIIDNTFSSGNNEIEKLSAKENKLLENIEILKKQIKDEVIAVTLARINTIITAFTKQFKAVMEKLTAEIDELNRMQADKKAKKEVISEQIKKLKESLEFLFGDQFDFNNLENDMLDNYIKYKKDWFVENKSKMPFNHEPNLLEITNELAHQSATLKGYQYKQVENDLEIIGNKITYINELIKHLKALLNYKVPSEYEEALDKYDKLALKEKSLDGELRKVANYKELVDKYHKKLLGKQREIVQNRLENHPIISWVYETINPHPFHKRLYITNTERGTNFVGRTQLEDKVDLYLDQIFSSAQLNILSLSIFLGLGLTQRYSKLQQLFLDDPIQSMDDVNVLAFIDVLRAIMDSRYSNKHMIISTHDEDFAQLLAIKMRNRDMVQYRIEGYTEEGPKIRKV